MRAGITRRAQLGLLLFASVFGTTFSYSFKSGVAREPASARGTAAVSQLARCASESKRSLFGLGGGGRSSTPRSGGGAASKARQKVESNAAFQGRMAKVGQMFMTDRV